jgi:SAM-dependent methyltransferase
VRFAPLITPGTVLDLACGRGRHARLLAARGYAVVALDRDQALLAPLAASGIQACCVDLETDVRGDAWPFAQQCFSGIVVTNYLHRPLLPKLLQSLAAGGVLIYETFMRGNGVFGKPSNPAFLLESQELLKLLQQATAPAMQVLAFEEGRVERPRTALIQRICARRLPLPADATAAALDAF